MIWFNDSEKSSHNVVGWALSINPGGWKYFCPHCVVCTSVFHRLRCLVPLSFFLVRRTRLSFVEGHTNAKLAARVVSLFRFRVDIVTVSLCRQVFFPLVVWQCHHGRSKLNVAEVTPRLVLRQSWRDDGCRGLHLVGHRDSASSQFLQKDLKTAQND